MRFTLGTAVWLALATLTLVLGVAFWIMSERAEARVAELAATARATAVDTVVKRVSEYLAQGDEALHGLEREFAAGRCATVQTAESCLLAALAGSPDLTEVTFVTEEGGSWQLTVYRAPDGRICTQYVGWRERQKRTACRLPYQLLGPAKPEGKPVELGDDEDPTDSWGYMMPFQNPGQVMRSDLSSSVFVDGLVRFLFLYGMETGTLKVGLVEPQLRRAVNSVRVNPAPDDPFRLFVCDPEGRLIAGLTEADQLIEYEDAFRIDPVSSPPAIDDALKHPALKELSLEVRRSDGTFDLEGRQYHVSFRALEGTQGWAVGVVGPDDYYLSDVKQGLRTLFLVLASFAALVLVGAIGVTRSLQKALGRIETETERMRKFDFTPSPPRSRFSDVREALWNLELAKTAMRALSRFVPVALVRRLFEANQEPELSSEPRELSVMFTDIAGFTTLVEHEEPATLAQWLGDYFAAMTTAVHAESGIVDKFIGDAVMALWNAPNTLDDHAVRACAAALRCLRETEALYATPQWAGRPKLVTRFGLHTSTVLVGHFGAPDRVSYTAIGDGVNLASRLEGLNKVFGTRIIVSEAIEARARHVFAFRKLDKVAVKGKSKAVHVFELLGPLDAPAVSRATWTRYEEAFAAYARRDFGGACALLSQQLDDGPSRVLHERCSTFTAEPPPPDWDGALHAEK